MFLSKCTSFNGNSRALIHGQIAALASQLTLSFSQQTSAVNVNYSLIRCGVTITAVDDVMKAVLNLMLVK